MKLTADYFELIPWNKQDVKAGVLFILVFQLFFLLFFLLPKAMISISMVRILYFVGEIPLLVAVWFLVLRKYPGCIKYLGFGRIDRSNISQAFSLFLMIYFLDFFYLFFLEFMGPVSDKSESKILFQVISSPELIFLMGAIVVPFIEELFFRGFIFAGLVRDLGWKRAAILSSLIFAFVHIVSPASIRFFPFYFGLGFGFAWLYYKTRSIVPSVIMHGVHNFLIYAIAYKHFISYDHLF
jgi:membrane protease YdiL (CAAX protease family)